ncbi:hypothetical protein, partial [Neisseria cinerea]|uniref:hypothetical protein n=1 Tax=Neisseria cinerea TaxID=483 RepID=UPI003C7CCD26
ELLYPFVFLRPLGLRLAIFFIKDVLQSYCTDWQYLICLCRVGTVKVRIRVFFFKGIAFLNNKP